MMSIDEYAITVGIAGSYPGLWLNTAINTRTSNHALGSLFGHERCLYNLPKGPSLVIQVKVYSADVLGGHQDLKARLGA
jgi:hypothetical protein